jgi:thioredoxin
MVAKSRKNDKKPKGGGVPRTNLERRLSHTATAGPVVEVDDASFGRAVAGGLPVLVDFWAPWCGPCKAMAPAIEQIAMERKGTLRVVKYNTEANRRVAADLEIRSIPTLALFRDGEVLDVKIGAQRKGALDAWIDGALSRT